MSSGSAADLLHCSRHWPGWQLIARPACKSHDLLKPLHTIDHLRIDDPKLGAILATQRSCTRPAINGLSPTARRNGSNTSASGQAKYASTASTVPGP